MPRIVEPLMAKARNLQDVVVGANHRGVIERCPLPGGEHEAQVLPLLPRSESLLELPGAMPLQRLDGNLWQS